MPVVPIPGAPSAHRLRGETVGRVWPGQRVFASEYTGDVRVTTGAPAKASGVFRIKFAFNATGQRAARQWLAACHGADNVHVGFDPDAGRWGPPGTAGHGQLLTVFSTADAGGLAVYGDKLIHGTATGASFVDVKQARGHGAALASGVPFLSRAIAVLDDDSLIMVQRGGRYAHWLTDDTLAPLTSATEPSAQFPSPQGGTNFGGFGAIVLGDQFWIVRQDGEVSVFRLSDVLKPAGALVGGRRSPVAPLGNFQLSADTSTFGRSSRRINRVAGLWPSPIGADRARTLARARLDNRLTEPDGGEFFYILDFGLRPLDVQVVYKITDPAAAASAVCELGGLLYVQWGAADDLYRYAGASSGGLTIRYDVTGVSLVEDANGWYEAIAVPWREV